MPLFVGYRPFLREARRDFHGVGAILPSGRFLARALARHVRDGSGPPRRLLEVGPGTGAVTLAIADGMGPDDRLDLVEANAAFVATLQQRFAEDPRLRRVADQVRIYQQRVEDFSPDGSYEVLVSSLPLNNFAVAEVERILQTFGRLTAPGGVVSFFEYTAIRPVRGLVSGPAERVRLRGVGDVLRVFLKAGRARTERVWLNVPPAQVHHVTPNPAPMGGDG